MLQTRPPDRIIIAAAHDPITSRSLAPTAWQSSHDAAHPCRSTASSVHLSSIVTANTAEHTSQRQCLTGVGRNRRVLASIKATGMSIDTQSMSSRFPRNRMDPAGLPAGPNIHSQTLAASSSNCLYLALAPWLRVRLPGHSLPPCPRAAAAQSIFGHWLPSTSGDLGMEREDDEKLSRDAQSRADEDARRVLMPLLVKEPVPCALVL